MKKYIAIALVLAVAAGIFVFSFTYRSRHESDTETQLNTTISSSDNSSSDISKDGLIAENKEGGYKLYYNKGVATLTYKDASLEFPGWSRSIEFETPTLYYNDFDGDGNNELIVRLADDFTKTADSDKCSYTLYLFKPTETDGKTQLAFITAQTNTWKNVFNNAVKLEVTQLKQCKKILQFAMNDINDAINYDALTGITDNKYVTFASAKRSDNREYYTLAKYNKGLGIYTVNDDGTVTLDIEVYINYKNINESFLTGNIHCELEIKNNAFKIKANSITFVPLDEYKVNDPREVAAENWNYKITNLSPAGGSDKIIKKLDADFSIDNGTASSIYFENLGGDMSNIDLIEMDSGRIILTPKAGYSFDTNLLAQGKYSVIADGIDISFVTILNGNSLVIKLDKTYDKEDISTFRVTFGE